MVSRDIEALIKVYRNNFRSLAIVGPRQSGKTTLARTIFKDKPYVSLEQSDNLKFAAGDPKGFLAQFPNGAVLDEAQRVPALFNYLQQLLDETREDCLFILTGSNNFLLQSSITQSLAGRIGYLDLLPLSLNEISKFPDAPQSTNALMLRGSYPEVYDKNRKPALWYDAYVRTYVERDVRQLSNIDNLQQFSRFLRLCAGRVGQQINYSALSIEAGADQKTIQKWLSILEASFIIWRLPPFYRNFNKRLVKTPKLYFYDTGLAAWLLSLRTEPAIAFSPFRGALFENLVINEFLKTKLSYGRQEDLFYWRDNKGLEIDLLIESGASLLPVEIKSGATFDASWLKNMKRWNAFAGNEGGLLLFDGKTDFGAYQGIRIKNWREASR